MKIYVSSSDNISYDVLKRAMDMVKCFDHTEYDIDNHRIVVPLSSGTTEDDVMSEGMLGSWLAENGFNLSFTVGDFEYLTKGTLNTRAMRREGAGNKRYLRNRTIMTITW